MPMMSDCMFVEDTGYGSEGGSDGRREHGRSAAGSSGMYRGVRLETRMRRRVSPALSPSPKIGKLPGATSRAARPKRAKVIPTPRISGAEYRRSARMQKDSERRVAWNLRHMLLRPQPSDPWNHESSFSAGAVLTARQGRRFLAMSDATNNTDSAQSLRREMMTHRRIRSDNAYMRHLQEYTDAGKNTRNTTEKGPSDIWLLLRMEISGVQLHLSVLVFGLLCAHAILSLVDSLRNLRLAPGHIII